MNKTAYIITVIILILIGAIVLTTLNTDKAVTQVEYNDTNIIFPDSSGKNIETENFLTKPEVKPDEQNPGLYVVGSGFGVDPQTNALPQFSISYDKENGFFNITLLEKPFNDSRLAAEKNLVTLLNITESKMCGLNYMVTVPGYVDQNASGIDYRFSFCDDAVNF